LCYPVELPVELAAAVDRLVLGSTFNDTTPEFIVHQFSPPISSLIGTILSPSQEQTESNNATCPVNDTFKIILGKGLAAKFFNHRVHREHRAVPLIFVSSVLSVVFQSRR
jgi:hypothetical protein